MELGKRLRRAREQAGLSQKDLEAKSGVSQKTISKIERGDQEGSTQIAQLAKACAVRVEWLASEDGPMRAGQHAAEPGADYLKISPEALELARAWDRMGVESQAWTRELIFTLAVIEHQYPWLRRGRPQGETYDQYERRIERDFTIVMKKIASGRHKASS